MRVTITRAVFLLSILGSFAGAQELEAGVPSDFRMVVQLRQAATGALAAAELIAYQGRVLQIIDGQQELLLIDPVARRIELLDLNRKRLARISFDRLDAETDAYKRRLQTRAEKLATSDRRADKIDAEKTRDLIQPTEPFQFSAASHSLRLKGPTAEVEATGVPGEDPNRLRFIAQTLSYLIKLDTYRAPEKVPPFLQLKTLESLTHEHALRPAEMSFLYRINGPPVRFEWSYRVTPGITAEDRTLWLKLDKFLKTARVVDVDAYDAPRFRSPPLSAPTGR